MDLTLVQKLLELTINIRSPSMELLSEFKTYSANKIVFSLNSLDISESDRLQILRKLELDNVFNKRHRLVDITVGFDKLIQKSNSQRKELENSHKSEFNHNEYNQIEEFVMDYMTNDVYWIVKMRDYLINIINHKSFKGSLEKLSSNVLIKKITSGEVKNLYNLYNNDDDEGRAAKAELEGSFSPIIEELKQYLMTMVLH